MMGTSPNKLTCNGLAMKKSEKSDIQCLQINCPFFCMNMERHAHVLLIELQAIASAISIVMDMYIISDVYPLRFV